jgi:hypothetical protein
MLGCPITRTLQVVALGDLREGRTKRRPRLSRIRKMGELLSTLKGIYGLRAVLNRFPGNVSRHGRGRESPRPCRVDQHRTVQLGTPSWT